jgi:hypothetical protein
VTGGGVISARSRAAWRVSWRRSHWGWPEWRQSERFCSVTREPSKYLSTICRVSG